MVNARWGVFLVGLALLCGGRASAQSPEALREFERALREERAGNLDSARAAYICALAADSVSVGELVPARLEALLAAEAARGRDPFLAARRLASLGRDEAALEALEAAVRENPHREVPADLRFLSGGEVGELRDARSWIARRKAALQLAVGLLTVILFCGVLAFRKVPETELEIGKFEASTGDGPAGPSFTALLADDLKRLSRGAGERARSARSIELVRGPIEATPIPKMVEALIPGPLSWLKALPTLLQWLTRSPKLGLSGTLHRVPRRGAGVSLVLMRNGRTLASETLWESHFSARGEPVGSEAPAVDRFAWLAEPAATWLLYHLQRALCPGEEFQPLGTGDWRSYAMFRVGLRYEEEDNPAAARDLYERALSRDAGNRGARANLAALLMAQGEDDRAIDELLRVVPPDPLTYDLTDPVTYSALYRLAAARFHSGRSAEALASVRTLMQRIDTAQRHASTTGDDLQAFVESIRPSCEVLLAGIEAHEATTSRSLEQLAARLALSDALSTSTDAVVQYNLACTYWILATNEHAVSPDREAWVESVFLHLKRAFELSRAHAGWAPRDPSLRELFAHRELRARARKLVTRYDPSVSFGPPVPSLLRWIF